MMRLRSATLLLAVHLLTSAATARAECAWVLWEHRVTPSKGAATETWLAQEAVETRAVCEAKSEALIQRLGQASASGAVENYAGTCDRERVTRSRRRRGNGRGAESVSRV